MIRSSSSQPAVLATNLGLHSNLFATVFERLQVSTRLNVLDMGFASPSTVQFFNQFKCKLHFVDLYAEEFIANPQEEATHERRGRMRAISPRLTLNLAPTLPEPCSFKRISARDKRAVLPMLCAQRDALQHICGPFQF